MANANNNKKRKKAQQQQQQQQQPLCLQSTVEQVARKLRINNINNSSSSSSPSSQPPPLSSVEDQFRLLGTRIAVGRLCSGWDTVERRAAVLLQQHYGLEWNIVAAALGAPGRDVKKFELLQHVVRNHLQQPAATTTAAAAAVPRPAVLAHRSSCQRGTQAPHLPAVVDEDQNDNDDAKIYTPKILPSIMRRLLSSDHHLLGDDDPHGVEQRAVALLRYIHRRPASTSTSCHSDQQQRAHLYELRRYAAAYEAAAVVVVVTTATAKKKKNAVPVVEAAVVAAAAGACTRLEMRHVLPRVRQAHVSMISATAGSSEVPRGGGPAAGTKTGGRAAGIRLAAASLKRKAADHQEQQQQKQQSYSLRCNNARTERPDDAENDSDVGASWFDPSILEDNDTFAAMTTTTMDGHYDIVDDEWKNNVLADARKEHDESLERAALHVLAKWDCRLD